MRSLKEISAWAVLLLLLAGGTRLQAQSLGRDYAILLADSSVIRGKLLNYQPGETVSVRLRSGRVFNYEAGKVLRVMPYRDYRSTGKKPVRPYRFRERGWFGDLQVATFLAGTFGDPAIGGGFHGTFGYRWNRWLETGLGLGYERYRLERPFRVVPVFARVRGYLTKTRVAPYYQLEGGYGWGLKKPSDRIIDAGGGAMVHPAVGVRFGAGSVVNFHLDLGYRFQWVSYTRDEWWEATTVENYTFKRLTLRLGLLF